MRYLILLAFILTVSTSIFAQNFTLPLWNREIPNYQATDEVEIRDSTDIVRISFVQKPDIAVFLPAKKTANGQAVVIFPGGGYRRLAYDYEGSEPAKLLNSRGIAAIVVKYRLPNSKSNVIPHKSPLLDAQRALRITRLHADEWNIDKEQIGILGFSAGGHLASTLGTHFDNGDVSNADPVERMSCRPDFMILGYPVITMNADFTHMGSRTMLLGDNPDPKLIKYYSNELQVSKDTPPTFIMHASDDNAVPVENSLVFYKALLKNNIPVEMHIYPEGGHGFSLASKDSHLRDWTERMFSWLEQLEKK
jgi:acetyl esterase/lipase